MHSPLSVDLRERVVSAVSKVASCNQAAGHYVTDTIVPMLKPGDTVILDNLQVHKVTDVCEAIEEAGARLLYLPPYSPDFNPIE